MNSSDGLIFDLKDEIYPLLKFGGWQGAVLGGHDADSTGEAKSMYHTLNTGAR